MRYPVVLFDLDGTVIDSGAIILASMRHAAETVVGGDWEDAELMKRARGGALDVVVVWRLDRWGDSMADLGQTLQELNALGVGFVSLSEPLDLTTPSGRAMAEMLGVFAEFERKIRRERVKAGISRARQRGLWPIG